MRIGWRSFLSERESAWKNLLSGWESAWKNLLSGWDLPRDDSGGDGTVGFAGGSSCLPSA